MLELASAETLTVPLSSLSLADAAPPPGNADTRFRELVQSPLRAALLRFLSTRRGETFDIEALMAAVGNMRQDVLNCLDELVAFGVVQRVPAAWPRFTYAHPSSTVMAQRIELFLAQRGATRPEDHAPSVQHFRDMIGRDEKMLVLFEWIRTAAKSDIAVLISGPTGSGKEVVARMIHELSRRERGPFQAVNCAALPDSLFESEVFGHEKGAFTGAHERKSGRLELADHGTLFLDEIGDLSMVGQAKLLRVLEDRRVERLGSQRSVQVDFRLVSASNRPLEQLVEDGNFREDLYYRVNAFTIRLPSLRERPIDIGVLAKRFAARCCVANGLEPDAKIFAIEAVQRLQSYAWPGNIRELESTVSRAVLSVQGPVIRDTDLDFLHTHPSPSAAPEAGLGTLRDAERIHIARVLETVAWNKKEAARMLAISRGTLYRKIQEYSLDKAGLAPQTT